MESSPLEQPVFREAGPDDKKNIAELFNTAPIEERLGTYERLDNLDSKAKEISLAAEETLFELQQEMISADFGPAFIRSVIKNMELYPGKNRQDVYLETFTSIIPDVRERILHTYPEISPENLGNQIMRIYASILEDITKGTLGKNELAAAEHVLRSKQFFQPHPTTPERTAPKEVLASAPSITSFAGVPDNRIADTEARPAMFRMATLVSGTPIDIAPKKSPGQKDN